MKLQTLTTCSVLLLLFTILGFRAEGQPPTFTGGCDEIPANAQEAADCLLCNFDTFVGTTAGYTPSELAGWCGTIENDQYIGFRAGPTGAVSFELAVFNCNTHEGLQVGIYDLSNNLIGDCFNQIEENWPQIFSADSLTPGEIYFIRVDGFAGEECDFTLTIISGLINGPSPAIDDIDGPNRICLDVDYTFSVPNAQASATYLWMVAPGAKVANYEIDDPAALLLPYGGGSEITLNFDGMTAGLAPGECDTVNISVKPVNLCFPVDSVTSTTINICQSINADTTTRNVTYASCQAGYFDVLTDETYTSGTHYFTRVDSNRQHHCGEIIELVVSQTPAISIDFDGAPYICDSTTTLIATPSGGYPPYTFNWSGVRDTGLTSTIATPTSRSYRVVVEDSLGCYQQSTYVVADAGDYQIPLDFIGTDCQGDGGFVSLDSNLIDDLQIVWSTGEVNTGDIGPLPVGRYNVRLTLPNSTCGVDSTFYVARDSSCLSIISGYVVVDTATSCTDYTAHHPLSNVAVTCSNGLTNFADSNGYYEFVVDTGTYTIQILPGATDYTPVCTQSYTLNVADYEENLDLNNFYFVAENEVDILVTIGRMNAVVGRPTLATLYAINKTAFPKQVDLTFSVPSIFSYYNLSSPDPDLTFIDTSIIWRIDALAPFSTRFKEIPLFTDSTATPGEKVYFRLSTDATTTALDLVPTDNSDLLPVRVGAAYDPNDKGVTPAGEGVEGFIATADSLLQYTIRFQNTGTADAQYVRLEDVISNNLDITTLQPLAASHPFKAFYNEDRKLVVTFDPIQLPPDSEDFEASQGFFTYTIKQQKDLQPGDQISNTAGIFFDFNPAIITNTTLNTIEFPEVIEEPDTMVVTQPVPDAKLYPNPTTGELTIIVAVDQQVEDMTVVAVDGRVVGTVAYDQVDQVLTCDVSSIDLITGMYNLRLKLTSGETLTKRFVLQR